MSRRPGVLWQHPGVCRENAIAVSEPRISQSVARVQLDGILEAPNRQMHRSRHSVMPVMTSLEVEFVGRQVLRRSFYAATQPYVKPLRNAPGNLILKLEEVLHLTIIALRPQVEPAASINELHSNADTVACTAHAAFQHIRHIELARNFADLNGPALEGER